MSLPKAMQGHVHSHELQLVTEFITWRHEVDDAYLLDTFDLALGWFAAKGLIHDRCCDLAMKLKDATLCGGDEIEERDRPFSVFSQRYVVLPDGSIADA